ASRHVHARRPPPRLDVDRRALAHVRAHVRDVHPHAHGVPREGLRRDRVVEIAGARGVDRERRQTRQVAAARSARGGRGLVARAPGRPQHAALEPAREPARAHQLLDRAARALARARRPNDPGVRRACATRRPRWARSRSLHRTFPARARSATFRPCAVSTPRGTTTSGVMPAPCLTPPPPRLRPSGVKYSPTVMSSAPPLESGCSSWKTPLPNVCVTTIVARR